MYTTKSITNKFWILHRLGERVGTIRLDNNVYELIIDGNQTNLSYEELVSEYGQDILVQSHKQSINTNVAVYDYPTSFAEVFNSEMKDHLPVFTKTKSSKTYHCAGYYGIRFPKGWVTSHCPKLQTLEGNQHIGPFKSEQDMLLAIKREKECESNPRMSSTIS